MNVRMKQLLGRSGLILLLAVLQGCSVLPRPEAVAVDHYTLDTPTVALAESAADAPVLLIARPQVRADLDTPRMAYRQQAHSLRYYARSRWSDAPAQLLLPGLIEAFEASGAFAAVLRTGSPATPRLRLDTELLEFSLDYRSQPGVFQLRLRAQLVDLSSRRVLASHIFSVDQALQEQSPYAGAQAANAAWQQLLPEVLSFCIAALPQPAP